MLFKSFYREWKELFRFRALDAGSRSIVFYAEDSASWAYLESLVRELIGPLGKQICYITSSLDDPLLRSAEQRLRTFYIGSGSARTILFLTLQADVLVMTMPDLGTFHIKRSNNPVHYVYVYHSIVSTHMSYRLGAFDQYDAVFCVGPHHKEEIRATEALYNLKPKILVEHGYGRLDSILSSEITSDSMDLDSNGEGRRVLVAPSWGDHALLETLGAELIEVLLDAGHTVTVRPHPMTLRHRPKLPTQLRRRFGFHPSFKFDPDIGSIQAFQSSDLIITDWGGTGMEYAFGLERPVLFVDVPRKVVNPEYERLSCEPIEVKLRKEIGAVVSPDRLADVPNLVDELCCDPMARREQVRTLRSQWIYNVGTSGAAGAAYIVQASETVATPNT